jgi:hypothetical protein
MHKSAQQNEQRLCIEHATTFGKSALISCWLGIAQDVSFAQLRNQMHHALF